MLIGILVAVFTFMVFQIAYKRNRLSDKQAQSMEREIASWGYMAEHVSEPILRFENAVKATTGMELLKRHYHAYDKLPISSLEQGFLQLRDSARSILVAHIPHLSGK